MNMDTTWFEGRRVGGVGWVAQDSSDMVVQAGYCYIREKQSVKFLEAFALLHGLRNIQNLEGYDIHLETDSHGVVKLVEEEDVDISEICWIVDEIKILLARKSMVSVNFIHREANSAAHQIARLFTEDEGAIIWDEGFWRSLRRSNLFFMTV